MTIATVPCYDATHANIASLPPGQAAGYTTGSGDVPWTSADKAAHPGFIQIDQSPVNTALDELADVLDFERGAATLADLAPWAKAALANYRSAARPGQRSPAIYASRAAAGYSIHDVANALITGGVTSGIGLWIADWNNDVHQATAEVAFADGPFPVIGRQYRNAGAYDVSVFSVPWLAAVSGKAPPLPVPPGWAYPIPQHLAAAASRAVTLSWAAAVPPAGRPAAGSYTVAVYGRGGVLVRQVVVTGLTAVISGLGAGNYSANVTADGGSLASPHATVTFAV